MQPLLHSAPPRPRAGITIVEVLLALILVSIGLLGMAGTSALALRSAGAAAREHRAARVAALRLARLAASGCDGPRSGEAADDATGLRERWTIEAARNGAALVEEQVAWIDERGARTLTLASALVC